MRFQFSWAPLLVVAGVLLFLIVPLLLESFHDDPLLKQGTPAKARVLAIRPTGSSRNDDLAVRIDLEVQPQGQEPYTAEVATYLSPVYLARYHPGALGD